VSVDDRDYYREQPESGLRIADVPPTAILIGVNVIAYLLQVAVTNAGPASDLFVGRHLALSWDGICRFEIWQIATAPLLHADFMHLFWNMFGLYVFGGIASAQATRREYFRLYVASALGGSLAFVAWAAAGMEEGGVPMVGASGAVTGILLFAALRAPTAKILLFFVLPVSLWFIALMYIGVDVATALSRSVAGIAVMAHLGGAATAALLHFGWRGAFRRKRRRVPLRGETEVAARSAREDADAARVDALLERIHADGIGSLSDEEREFLKRASERRRER
jgi:membrane associated rhomboid family serine protease